MDHQPYPQPSSTLSATFLAPSSTLLHISATLSATREERREEEARELIWKEKGASRQPRQMGKIRNPLAARLEGVASSISNIAER
jgi:hypothetical protein